MFRESMESASEGTTAAASIIAPNAATTLGRNISRPLDSQPRERGNRKEARWQVVDRALREIGHRRAALDADEARWLREAEALQIWRPLGMVSAIDYLERVLDYAPRTAQDRLRVARALGALPRLTKALADGRLSFSAIRELTRVATPATEAAWVAAAAGKNLRQVEELVADHRPGDRPEDPPSPEARVQVVRFELTAETYALLRQARVVLDDEHGTNLSDDALVAALCSSVLDGAPASEPTGRAKVQVALTVCKRCSQGWQEGAGAQIAVDKAVVERAMCDAQHIGSIDGAGPERAHQDISPSVARFVWRRDGGRCCVPGCRSARALELHHLVRRADGGSHEASNLILLCGACHRSHHEGVLAISGTAEHLDVQRPSPSLIGAHVGVERAKSVAGSTALEAYGEGERHTGQRSATGTRVNVKRLAASANRPDTGIANEWVEAHQPSATGAHVGVGSTKSVPDDVHIARSNRLSTAIVRSQAKVALTRLGWKPAIAASAVDATLAAMKAEAANIPIERLIFESLRRCPLRS